MGCQTVIFHIINVLVGAMIMAGGVIRCIVAVGEGQAGNPQTFSNFVIGAYIVLFGFVIVMVEFAVPLFIVMYASFFHTFMGKSFMYLFLGVLIVLGPPSGASPMVLYTFIAGIIIVFIALLYFIFHFIPSIQRPRAMFYSAPPPTEM